MSQFNLSRMSHWEAVEPVAVPEIHAPNRIIHITDSTDSTDSTGSPDSQRLNWLTRPLAQALAHGTLNPRTHGAATLSSRPGIAYQKANRAEIHLELVYSFAPATKDRMQPVKGRDDAGELKGNPK
jgi:hypothetical protein